MPWTSATAWLGLGALGLAGLLVSEWKGFRPGIVAGKLTASTAFVALAIALATQAPEASLQVERGLAGRFGLTDSIQGVIILGLLLCWLGDALLLPPGQTIWFRLGIGAFLLGHVAYAMAFYTWGLDLPTLGIATLGIGLAAIRISRWLRPHCPDEFRVAVGCYVVVIGLMLACAIAAGANGLSPYFVAGAAAFAVSDLSVARERFVQASFANSLWGLPLYYAAQFSIVWGLTSLTPN